METWIGIDIGTTNCKVGVCNGQYELLELYTMATPRKQTAEGDVYDPEVLGQKLLEFVEKAASLGSTRGIGISSMAEAGALVDVETGNLVSDLLPWQDPASAAFLTEGDRLGDRQRFFRTGLHVAYKYSLYKVLAYRAGRGSVEHLRFLPAASLAAWYLTGQMVTDITLAARTYACDIYKEDYDGGLLERRGLPPDIFPEITAGYAGTWRGIRVYVAGHDHVCAAVAAGISEKNREIFLSLGTTGVMMGCMPLGELTREDYDSGYVFGRHPDRRQMTWMGALQSAGASIDWILEQTGAGYDIFGRSVCPEPAGILYYPYINGSGPPQLLHEAGGAFLGLSRDTRREELAAAVLQGIAFEIRFMLEHRGGAWPGVLKATGGCTKNPVLMQILANVTECEIAVLDCEQAALLGAVMIGRGVTCGSLGVRRRFVPEACYRERYAFLYREYLKFRPAILAYKRRNIQED